eukprot:365592-Chlamydomonas_euryale.AAC.6
MIQTELSWTCRGRWHLTACTAQSCAVCPASLRCGLPRVSFQPAFVLCGCLCQLRLTVTIFNDATAKDECMLLASGRNNIAAYSALSAGGVEHTCFHQYDVTPKMPVYLSQAPHNHYDATPILQFWRGKPWKAL